MTGHVIVVDLGYGDAGKGGIVDYLCARETNTPVHAVVRFNGGAQAAHHVLAPNGAVHAFAQFGSGTFTPGVRTFLSRFMLVDPLAMTAEAAHLRTLRVQDPFGLITVDRDALLTTPYHQAANRARELAREANRHGSCGMGIGETARYALCHPKDAPRAGDCETPRVLTRKLTLLRDRLAEQTRTPKQPPPSVLADVYATWARRVMLTADGHLATLLRKGPVVFEGAQGVLLDEWHGFHPYTTWSTTTFANAETLLAEAGETATRLGVTRCHLTRHGPGPFVTEDPALDLTESHNQAGRWQGPVRKGHLDAVALRYATEVAGGLDAVALTHLDTARRHEGALRLCREYAIGGQRLKRLDNGPARDLVHAGQLTRMLLSARPVYDETERIAARDWPDLVAGITGAPVTIRSHGPAAANKTAAAKTAAAKTAATKTVRKIAPIPGRPARTAPPR